MQSHGKNTDNKILLFKSTDLYITTVCRNASNVKVSHQLSSATTTYQNNYTLFNRISQGEYFYVKNNNLRTVICIIKIISVLCEKYLTINSFIKFNNTYVLQKFYRCYFVKMLNSHKCE